MLTVMNTIRIYPPIPGWFAPEAELLQWIEHWHDYWLEYGRGKAAP